MFELMTNAALYVHYVTDTRVFWVACALILVMLMARRYRYEAIVFGISLLLTTGAVQLLKTALAVTRPDDALVALSSYAFPSGHAAAGAFLVTMVTWLLRRTASLAPRRTATISALVFIALAIGTSRIFIGVHTPLQVLAGYVVGIMVPLLTVCAASTFRKRLWVCRSACSDAHRS